MNRFSDFVTRSGRICQESLNLVTLPEGEDGVCISVAIAVIPIAASVTAGPDEDAALALATLEPEKNLCDQI